MRDVSLRMITNWAGNLTYSTTLLKEAHSEQEARAWITGQERFKVLGTRHCFNDIADSRQGFLSLDRLNRIDLDPVGRRVAVGPGVRYGELAQFLYDQGWALHNLASLPHISVVGGCATATHGSGTGNANLPAAVAGMEFVTATGETVRLSRESDRDRLRGAVVHLGGIGVIVQLTLAIEPAYQMVQYVYEDLPMAQLEHHFDEIMEAGYSVSLFTDWRNEQISSVWIKSRLGTHGSFGHRAEFFGARAATRDLHPIPGIAAENCTPQLGAPGPWHERLPHFRMGFMPSSGDELQSEYFVPREYSFPAILAVEALHTDISPHLLISEVRCIAADDAWMSPCAHMPATAIHFTWKPEWKAVERLLPKIEAALSPFGAKPHWGKLFTLSHTRLAQLYPKMEEFRQLLQHYDPAGKFRNAYLDRVIFGR